MEMKDIPLVKGSRVKLVLGMKGGPISSKRLFTISSDYDNWLDMSDVLSGLVVVVPYAFFSTLCRKRLTVTR